MPPPLTSPVRVPACAGWHHAMNRVGDGDTWLNGPSEASSFVADVERIRAAFPIDIHAYCVLPRHYHLLVRAEPEPLSAALCALQSWAGFPGGDSPRVLPVVFGRHLTGVSRYVHLNPVLAGLVRRPEHWPYSSFRAYLGDLAAPRFVVTAAVLGRFGPIGARHRHRAYVEAGLHPESRDRDGRPRWSVLSAPGSSAGDLAWRVPPVLAVGPLPPPASAWIRASPCDTERSKHPPTEDRLVLHAILAVCFALSMPLSHAAAKGVLAPDSPDPVPAHAASSPLADPDVPDTVESIRIVIADKAKTDGEIRFSFNSESGEKKEVRVAVAKAKSKDDVATDVANGMSVRFT